jgi:PEP-CTERM motif
MRSVLFRRLLSATLTFVSMGAGASFADVTYTFVGTPYNFSDIVRPDLVTDTFTSDNRVSVELEFSTPLVADLNYDAATIQPRITPLSWMISDGNVTMTSANAVLIYTQLSTNSLGQINAWAIAVDLYTDGIPTYEVGVFSGYQPGVRTDLPPYDARDYTEEFADLDGVQVYIESNGTLANSPDNQWVATPEPSTWAMMLLGFGGLGYAGYRRRSSLSAS